MSLLPQNIREMLSGQASDFDQARKVVCVAALNEALKRRDLFGTEDAKKLAVNDEAKSLLSRNRDELSDLEIRFKGVSESSLLAGECGAGEITAFDHSDYAVHFACEVKDFDPTDWVDRKAARRMDRFTHLILAAARQAVSDSSLEIEKEADRIGAAIATGIGGLRSFQECHSVLVERGPDRVSPFSIPAIIPNLGAGCVCGDDTSSKEAGDCRRIRLLRSQDASPGSLQYAARHREGHPRDAGQQDAVPAYPEHTSPWAWAGETSARRMTKLQLAPATTSNSIPCRE